MSSAEYKLRHWVWRGCVVASLASLIAAAWLSNWWFSAVAVLLFFAEERVWHPDMLPRWKEAKNNRRGQ